MKAWIRMNTEPGALVLRVWKGVKGKPMWLAATDEAEIPGG